MLATRVRLVVLLSLGACKSTCAGAATTTTTDAAAQAPVEPRHAAYILSPKKITVVEDGRVTELARDRFEWKHALGRDGSLYSAGDGVRRIHGDVMTKLSDEAAFDVAAGPDGKIWEAVQGGVLVLDGSAKKMLPAPETPERLVVTPRGPVFVSRLSVFTLEGETWQKDDAASGLLADAGEIRGVTSTPKGQIYVVGMGMFLRREPGGTWQKHALPKQGWARQVGAASPKEKVPVLTADGVVLLGPDGEVHPRALDLPGDLADVTALALDGSDRLWISATFGLFVFGPDDKLLQRWPSGAIPTSAREILVHGEGPALPRQAPPAIKGIVKGTVSAGGKPIANASVEMIANPALAGFERAKVRLSSTTNAAGEFTFFDVPRQDYTLVHKAGDRYVAANVSSDCCADLESGQTRDLGRLDLR